MTVRLLTERDQTAWWEMRADLFHDATAEELREPVAGFAGVDQVAFVWEDGPADLRGFVEASVRRHADGCATSPVGFLEAWYVVPESRGRGIGRALVKSAEEWARSKGCTEMGSDTWAADDAARAAHVAVGFHEVEVAVHFAKQFVPSVAAGEAGPPPGAAVTLRPITDDNVRAVCDLQVDVHQRAFVAPNAVSLAQAYATTKVWPRAIYADDTPVGFLMLSDDDEQPRYYLWRFMIDRRYQGRGFGRAAMDLLEGYVRTRPGGARVYLSHVPAPGGPEGFYRSCGYEPTGVEHGGELEMVKRLEA